MNISFAIFSLCLTFNVLHLSHSQCFPEAENFTLASSNLQHVAKFSLDLLRELIPRNASENLFFSPYSVWNAFALTYLGSAGKTEQQMQKILRITDKVSTLMTWRAIDYIYKVRQFESETYSFGLVNKTYFDRKIELRKCILNVLSSELELVDFTKPEEAALTINNFVSTVTERQISNVISPDQLDNVHMTLVNVAFFRDIWKVPFDRSQTREKKFYPFTGKEQTIDMMMRTGEFKHGLSEKLRAHVLELPYTLKNISMFVFLPPSVEGENGLNYLLQHLNIESLESAIQDVWLDNIEIAFPKMSISSSFDSQLKEALERLGVRDLFQNDAANLTVFVPNGGVSVSKSIHEATLTVSEEGTEAASVTSVIGTARSARPSRLRAFICDHPFVYLIYDKLTKNILFMGVFRNSDK